MSTVFVFMLVVFTAPGLYILAHILTGKPVKARLANIQSRPQTDRKGRVSGGFYAVYTYTEDGVSKQYESRLGYFVPFGKKDVKTIWLGNDGKVYELETALAFLAIAGVLLLMYFAGVFTPTT